MRYRWIWVCTDDILDTSFPTPSSHICTRKYSRTLIHFLKIWGGGGFYGQPEIQMVTTFNITTCFTQSRLDQNASWPTRVCSHPINHPHTSHCGDVVVEGRMVSALITETQSHYPPSDSPALFISGGGTRVVSARPIKTPTMPCALTISARFIALPPSRTMRHCLYDTPRPLWSQQRSLSTPPPLPASSLLEELDRTIDVGGNKK